MKVLCLIPENKQMVRGFAEAAYALTPRVSLIGNAIFLEVERVEHLISFAEIQEALRELAQKFETSPRIGCAEDPATARAFALTNKNRREDLPLESLYLYAEPFADEFSIDLKPCLVAFERLGVKNCGELAKIPWRGIASRFGAAASLALTRWQFPLQEPWPSFQPEQIISEVCAIEPEYDVRLLEPLFFVLRPLLDRVLARLAGRGHQLTNLQVILSLDRSSVSLKERIVDLSLAYPQAEAALILPILRERMNRLLEREPLPGAVNEVRLTVTGSTPGLARQRSYLHRREEEKEAQQSLLARLQERLGKGRAFLVELTESYRPERAWKKVLTIQKEFLPPFSERPLVLLKKPEALQLLDRQLIYRGKRYRIAASEGPERVAGEWWDKNFERSYYKILLETGECWWIFRVENKPEVFLHGIFE